MSINRKTVKRLLDRHEFGELFNQLGWDWPESDTPYPAQIGEELFNLEPVAHKRGFFAYHCPVLPDSAARAKIETRLSRDVREHIIIFTDPDTNKQRWQWVRRVSGQPLSRKEHEYLPSQPMLLIEKLCGLEIPMAEEEEIDLIGVFEKVQSSFDVERVTKAFYKRFAAEHKAFLKFIDGITELGDQEWYASVMLNRLMFIYFIQKKGFLDGDTDYLKNRLKLVQEKKGKGRFHTFYRYFLKKLCHEALAKKENDRDLDPELVALVGNVPYLNGGIFQEHELERTYPDIDMEDEAFEQIFTFFEDYEWHLDSRTDAQENEINPDVLGYIFEKYINQKQMGAYYTKEDITEYISKNTILPCLFDKAQKACKIAFEGKTSVWNLLKEDPDRYIYPAVRHGISYDIHNGMDLENLVLYPEEIAVGLDTSKPDLLERRKTWNTPTPDDAGLPTEIWRETVARRQRYTEVREKLERGEVRSINDLITLNLDIRQFAQDVIERCESPDLLNAFWIAIAGRLPQHSNEQFKPGITVLDPTCGSGAFLFAALNVLEPLYEACLERMKGFLEEWGDHPKHKNYAAFFKSIRDEIGRHPSHKYYIYKSIIIHNLYGVDIMKEAVEICKLRLFLKLVAQVEDGAKIEPLPDIDFNIRAGNTLVGFATQEEMKRALQGDLLAYQTVLPEILEQAEECDRLFNLFREAQLESDSSLGEAKQQLSNQLENLNVQLNQYLANDYGIDQKKKGDHETFLVTHQPFHWFIEFYGIMQSGGFDAIIGNPPYVEYKEIRKHYRIKNYKTENCGNLYAFTWERSVILTNQSAHIGLIIPVASVCTDGYASLQNIWMQSGSLVVSNFNDRPGKLFDGLEHIRLSVVLLAKGASQARTTYTTTYNKWFSETREMLFPTLCFAETTELTRAGSMPKIGNSLEHSVLSKILLPQRTLQHYVVRHGSDRILYTRKLSWFVQILGFIPSIIDDNGEKRAPSELKDVLVPSVQHKNTYLSALNSNLFYLLLTVWSDCRNLNKREVLGFPLDFELLDDESIARLDQLADLLMDDFQKYSKVLEMKYKKWGLMRIQCIYPKYSKSIIDEIDMVLAKYYGFTEEELDYIINYDIKYRMGKDLLEG